jgi:hypothetical protein
MPGCSAAFFTGYSHGLECATDAVDAHPTHELGQLTQQQIRLLLDKPGQLGAVDLVTALGAGFAFLVIGRLPQPNVDGSAAQ